MNIQDAIMELKTLEQEDKLNLFITRKKFMKSTIPGYGTPYLKFYPTDTAERIVCYTSSGRPPVPRFQPSMEDLVADDWVITS